MQITPTNFSTTINSPVFGAKAVYKDIKQIHGIHCGCCGREVIQADTLENVYKKIAKPLSFLFKQGNFESIKRKYSELYEYLKNLAILHPNQNLDQMVSNNIDVLRQCSQFIYKGLDLSKLNPKEARKQGADATQMYYWLRRNGRSALSNSAATIRAFEPHKKYLDGEKLKTFEQLEIYADKYPRKTLTEIINLPEVYEFHNAMDILRRGELNEQREYHFNKIRKLIAKQNPDPTEAFDILKRQAIEMIAGTMDAGARIPKLKKLYEQMLKQYNCTNIQPQIMAELEKIPTTFITKDSFLAYAKRHHYNDVAILESLFNPMLSSEEHIRAISRGGSDYIGNRVVFCRDCNQKRDNSPYTEFIQYHPQMPQNMQRQVDEISQQILAGKVSERFDFWPVKVAEILSEESNGQIRIDVSEFADKFEKKSKRKINKINTKRENLNKEKTELENLLKAKENECQQTELEYNEAVKGHNNFLKMLTKHS